MSDERPKGSLDLAIDLFDELRALIDGPKAASFIARHENQAKPRGGKP